MNIKNKIKYLLTKLFTNKKKDYDTTTNGLGLEPDNKDDRDYEPIGVEEALPTKFSLGGYVSKVEQQGSFNSCLGHAISTAVETFSKTRNWAPNMYMELSRMHCWNEARKLSGTWPDNKGAGMRSGWKAAKDEGITLEKLFPYTKNNMTVEDIGIAAKIFRHWYPRWNYFYITNPSHEDKEAAIKNALYNRQTIIAFGIGITPSFSNPNKENVYKPIEGETIRGGHALIITGWDDTKEAFEIQNSWGTSWGDEGRILVNKEWILKEAFSISYCDDILL